jgi:hypothetical protein
MVPIIVTKGYEVCYDLDSLRTRILYAVPSNARVCGFH